MEVVFEKCRATREDGQKEYAHKESNALENFEADARDLDIPREKVWAIFAGKHWRGIRAWVSGHRSQREDVRGRIKDLVVYLILLWAMVDDLEEQQNGAKRQAIGEQGKGAGQQGVVFGNPRQDQAPQGWREGQEARAAEAVGTSDGQVHRG